MLAPVRSLSCENNETSHFVQILSISTDRSPSEHRNWKGAVMQAFAPQNKEGIMQSRQAETLHPVPAPLPPELTAGWAGPR